MIEPTASAPRVVNIRASHPPETPLRAMNLTVGAQNTLGIGNFHAPLAAEGFITSGLPTLGLPAGLIRHLALATAPWSG
jgi:hypothetical protein